MHQCQSPTEYAIEACNKTDTEIENNCFGVQSILMERCLYGSRVYEK